MTRPRRPSSAAVPDRTCRKKTRQQCIKQISWSPGEMHNQRWNIGAGFTCANRKDAMTRCQACRVR